MYVCLFVVCVYFATGRVKVEHANLHVHIRILAPLTVCNHKYGNAMCNNNGECFSSIIYCKRNSIIQCARESAVAKGNAIVSAIAGLINN